MAEWAENAGPVACNLDHGRLCKTYTRDRLEARAPLRMLRVLGRAMDYGM